MPKLSEGKRLAGYQRWSNLAFFHWRVDPEMMQSSLPEGLRVDTFDGSAWIALVPFQMERIRPWWAFPVPGISWFLETNVRTYVKHENGQSGVWFFSLDANQSLAVWVARRFWHLNYVNASLQYCLDGCQIRGAGARRKRQDEAYTFAATIADQPPEAAREGTLEYFLLERYHLFARRPDGRFYSGQVHHEPYSYQPVNDLALTQTLTGAYGFPLNESPEHAVYSKGVDVVVSPIELI